MKRICSTMLGCLLLISGIGSAQAAETGMYVNNAYVSREFDTIGQFDMVPILDIAGELGYGCDFDGSQFRLYNDNVTYTFTMGSADVFSHDGTWFGLDVVPQFINGRVMIPANFLIYILGTPYTWDNVTQTLFINSNYSYRWLTGTKEYKEAKAIDDTWNAIQGWWKHEGVHFGYNNIYFSPDGRACFVNMDDISYGVYSVTAANTIEVNWFGGYVTQYYYDFDLDCLEDMTNTTERHILIYDRGRSDMWEHIIP